MRNIIKRYQIRRLRQILRGHRYLEKTNSLGRINTVRRAMETAQFYNGSAYYSPIIFGSGVKNAETIVQQYLLNRVATFYLGKSLLHALGKPGSAVHHPLPSEWRKIVGQYNFKVSKIRSAFVWKGFLLLFLCYGLVSIGRKILFCFKEIIRPSFPELRSYVFFEDLTAGQLPQPCNDGRSYDIITWYRQWVGRVIGLDNLCHRVKGASTRTLDPIPVVSLPSILPPLTQNILLWRYIIWAIAASLLAIFDLIRGRWWHALMLSEASSAALVKLQNPNKLAREYLFHNSNHTYRPLWTYEAEKKGSRIIFYFYSANVEAFKCSKEYPPPWIGWRTATWPIYLVWDKYQADFIRRSVSMKPNINIVGSIWFNASPNEMPVLPPNSIAVFDVQPVRDAFYQTLGIDFDYYIPNTCNQFLIDIFDSLKKHKATLILKRKREIGKLSHYKYRNLLTDLKKQNNFIEVENTIEAQRIIENCTAVISMPFTSTALLGRELKKPSIYYDPHGQIQKDDRGAHGIPIITDIEELREWVATVLSQ
ncbi:MAG: polysaccharide biosynthesis PFTS motif protein [Bacteroidia bacterium]|nr:polysaccharide biosynthesis PFTS motif protein [Bacteroidia bacterium]